MDRVAHEFRNATILNVNDHEATRRLLTRLLERAGFRVVEATTGTEALERMKEHPALVVLDAQLRDMSGLDVCRAIKSDPAAALIPILQTSATFTSTEHKVHGYDSGADGYLTQPIAALELIATVRALLRAREAEVQVKRATVEWQQTFDAVRDPLLLIDEGGAIIRTNRAFAQLLGKVDDDLCGLAIVDALSAVVTDGEAALQSLTASDTNPRDPAEIQIGELWYRLTIDPMSGTNGGGARNAVILTDITRLKHLALELGARADQLVQQDKRKDEFLAMLAHELRNPLNAAATAVALLERLTDGDQQLARLCSVIQRQNHRLARMVDDLLDVSRITRSKIQLKLETIDICDLIDAAVELVGTNLQRRDQRIQVSMQRPLIVKGDALRLEQVLVNLMTNASKYSPASTTINVSAKVLDDGTAEVRIIDHGVGIPADRLEVIFELFAQLEQSLSRSLGGLGIGLTLARKITELHGGTLRAESDGLGLGSTLVLRVPRTADDRPAAELAPFRDVDAQNAEALDILVVEDNADAAEMLDELLSELGHRVSVSEDGESGLAAALRLTPDVAILDIGLPRIDGFELAESIRSSPHGESIYLIAATGYGRPEDRARAAEAGFDAYLVKPIDFVELCRMIDQPAIRQRKQQRSAS